MSEKPKDARATKAPKAWRGKPGYEHYGEPGPVRYPDGLGKRFGGWLYGLLTIWRR